MSDQQPSDPPLNREASSPENPDQNPESSDQNSGPSDQNPGPSSEMDKMQTEIETIKAQLQFFMNQMNNRPDLNFSTEPLEQSMNLVEKPTEPLEQSMSLVEKPTKPLEQSMSSMEKPTEPLEQDLVKPKKAEKSSERLNKRVDKETVENAELIDLTLDNENEDNLPPFTSSQINSATQPSIDNSTNDLNQNNVGQGENQSPPQSSSHQICRDCQLPKEIFSIERCRYCCMQFYRRRPKTNIKQEVNQPEVNERQEIPGIPPGKKKRGRPLGVKKCKMCQFMFDGKVYYSGGNSFCKPCFNNKGLFKRPCVVCGLYRLHQAFGRCRECCQGYRNGRKQTRHESLLRNEEQSSSNENPSTSSQVQNDLLMPPPELTQNLSQSHSQNQPQNQLQSHSQSHLQNLSQNQLKNNLQSHSQVNSQNFHILPQNILEEPLPQNDSQNQPQSDSQNQPQNASDLPQSFDDFKLPDLPIGPDGLPQFSLLDNSVFPLEENQAANSSGLTQAQSQVQSQPEKKKKPRCQFCKMRIRPKTKCEEDETYCKTCYQHKNEGVGQRICVVCDKFARHEGFGRCGVCLVDYKRRHPELFNNSDQGVGQSVGQGLGQGAGQGAGQNSGPNQSLNQPPTLNQRRSSQLNNLKSPSNLRQQSIGQFIQSPSQKPTEPLEQSPSQKPTEPLEQSPIRQQINVAFQTPNQQQIDSLQQNANMSLENGQQSSVKKARGRPRK